MQCWRRSLLRTLVLFVLLGFGQFVLWMYIVVQQPFFPSKETTSLAAAAVQFRGFSARQFDKCRKWNPHTFTVGIPPFIHYIYKSKYVPQTYRDNMESCRRLHPEMQFIFWTDELVEDFLVATQPEHIRDMYHAFEKGIERADVARLLILQRFGGIYMDLDVRCKKNILSLVKQFPCLLDQEQFVQTRILYNRPYSAMNDVMACEAGHPFFTMVVNYLLMSYRDNNPSILEKTGPHMLTKVFEIYQKTPLAKVHPVKLADPLWFSPALDEPDKLTQLCQGRVIKEIWKIFGCQELKQVVLKTDENLAQAHLLVYFCGNMTTPEEKICYVKEVTRYTSQFHYITYCAKNLCGKPRIYPHHVDSELSYSFLNCGHWTNQQPFELAFAPIDRRRAYDSDEFVEFSFEDSPRIDQVAIYETFHPGGVNKIRVAHLFSASGCINTSTCLWDTLWECDVPSTVQKGKCRLFKPFLLKVPTPPVCLMRIEFNCARLDYNTQLDAVHVVEHSQLHSPPKDKPTFDIVKLQYKMPLAAITDTPSTDNGGFDKISPLELLHIFDHLSWKDLFVLARVCKHLQGWVYEYLKQQRELNLQWAWPYLKDAELIYLADTLGYQGPNVKLRRLDLSWTGSYEFISSKVFGEFMEDVGCNLTSLSLQNCDFMDDHSLLKVVNVCNKTLEELNLSSCGNIHDFNTLSRLLRLRWLNVHNTKITESNLIAIISQCSGLAHLKVANCGNVRDMDSVIVHWRDANPSCVRSLNLWSSSLTSAGMKILTQSFPQLEHLDIGYCDVRYINGTENNHLIHQLASKCVHLKVLNLTKYNFLSNEDVTGIANHLGELEQLILVGSSTNWTCGNLEKVLQNCRQLKFLDVSCCDGVDNYTYEQFQKTFPSCSIYKYSS